MTEMSAAPPIPPPWNSKGFFSESDLKQAQEYYFQTHAKHAKLVAEGRNAQGLMKTMVRKKLTQEMGEDFKLYTGAVIGQTQEGDATGGIRGELNYLLRHIYGRVSKDQPITSPTQEDLAILKHPHGALEVCFGMVCYYQSLLVRHASLAGNRRKVLKSILDEELFKWIWRLTLSYLLSDSETKGQWQDTYLTAGLPYIPGDRQRAPLPMKLFEIGQFLLGKAVSESHLRIPLCFYFLTYLRTVQMHSLMHPGEDPLEGLYNELVQRAPDTPVDHVVIASDVLLNMVGNSGESFADLLNGKDITQFIPPTEAVFLLQFDPFCTEMRTVETLRAIIPHFNREEITEQGKASLMPLLMVLRSALPDTRKLMLEKIPIPVMVMLRNRMTNGPQDDLARKLAEALKTAMDERAKKGESVQVRPSGKDRVAGVSTVGVAAPAAEVPKPASRPAAAAPARPQAAPAPAKPAAAPKPATAAAEPAQAVVAEAVLDARLLVAWRMEGARLDVRTISARELATLAGREAQIFVPWVTIAFQTGQVFPPPAQVTPTLGGQLVAAVVSRVPADVKPRLPAPQVQALAAQAKGLTPQKFLLAVIAKSVAPDLARDAGELAPALAGLNTKFKANLTDFLRNPSKDDYRELRVNLTAGEKAAVSILQKVARLG